MILKVLGKVLYLQTVASIHCVMSVEVVVSTLYMLIDVLFSRNHSVIIEEHGKCKNGNSWQ